MKKKGFIVFIVLCLIILLIPFVGMAVAPTMVTTENKELSELPKIEDENGINTNYLGELGDYFQDHFAFRQQMVSANAAIYGKIFGASTTDQVLIGSNNWMYYTGTLDDYLVENVMTDRAIENAVHNIKLMQNYVEGRDGQFILAIAPNKNSIYDENMPYYYKKGESENNYEKLKSRMIQEGIHFVDLHAAFQDTDEVLYLERDSHWTNKGAVLAYNLIMSQTALDYENYENVSYEIRKDHLGDLTEMLYPLNSELENNEYYQKEWSWSYVNEVTDNMDEWIETDSPSENGTVLMYRDSFGESMLPFFAEAFGKGYFSRLVPYDLGNIVKYEPDYTIIERVERRISSFASEIPIMSAPKGRLSFDSKEDTETCLNIETAGGYYVFDGIIDSDFIQTDSEIFIVLSDGNGESAAYMPFYRSVETEEGINDYGYMMYVDQRRLPSDSVTVDVVVRNQNNTLSVKSQEVVLSDLGREGE